MLKFIAATMLALLTASAAQAEMVIDTTGWSNPKDGTQIPAYVLYDPAKARKDGTFPAVISSAEGKVTASAGS